MHFKVAAVFSVSVRMRRSRVFQENFAGAEWTAVTDQFFATIISPLNAKATGIWGRSFEVSTEQNTVGVEGAMRMPGFQVQPGQTYTARLPNIGRTENL